MDTYDWESIVERLTKLLRLQTPPVAMKWIKTEEELQSIPKVRILLDVCVLCMSPQQALLLLSGYLFEDYQKLAFTFVGKSTARLPGCVRF